MTSAAVRPPAPRRRGVTLLEIAVVVAIIAVLAAIFLPMLGSRIAANEAAALGVLRTFKIAMGQYYMLFRQGPPGVEDLVRADPPFVTVPLAEHSGAAGNPSFDRVEAIQAGYRFWFGTNPSTEERYTEAIPVEDGKTGNRRFRMYADGILRFAAGRDPTTADPPVR